MARARVARQVRAERVKNIHSTAQRADTDDGVTMQQRKLFFNTSAAANAVNEKV